MAVVSWSSSNRNFICSQVEFLYAHHAYFTQFWFSYLTAVRICSQWKQQRQTTTLFYIFSYMHLFLPICQVNNLWLKDIYDISFISCSMYHSHLEISLFLTYFNVGWWVGVFLKIIFLHCSCFAENMQSLTRWTRGSYASRASGYGTSHVFWNWQGQSPKAVQGNDY